MSPVDKAFKNVKRVNFLPPEQARLADMDMPLPIGYGVTNSQPYTVRKMLEWLEAQLGEKVLDVGSGSGWTTALLAKIVGAKGKVYAVEIIPELVERGYQNVKSAGIRNVKFFKAGSEYGLPKHAPYDRILVSAAATDVPPELLAQLKPGGKMVIPVGNDILEIEKNRDGNTETFPHHGFAFVPLIENQ